MSAYPLFSDGMIQHESWMSPNLEQATSLIVERARHLVNKLIEKRGHDKPPFLPEEFASLLGIKEIVRMDLGQTSAVLLRVHDGSVIKVNQNQHPVRQNFSCAHEIGHALFGELKLEPYIQSIEYRTFNPQGERDARAAARERLCDAAATELLMPESVFKTYLSGLGASVKSVERLANIFRVSFQATAIRIAEISIEPCITLVWKPRLKAKAKSLELALRVGPGRSSRDKAKYIPVNIFAKNPSKLYEAFEYDKPVKSSKVFKIDSGTKRLPMESKGFGHAKTRYVLSLAFLDR